MFCANERALFVTVRTVAALGVVIMCAFITQATATSAWKAQPRTQSPSRGTGCTNKPVITEPREGASVSYTDIVKGTTTCNGLRHYVIVTPPNGVDYVQNKECAFPSRNAFTCSSVQFGEGRVG